METIVSPNPGPTVVSSPDRPYEHRDHRDHSALSAINHTEARLTQLGNQSEVRQNQVAILKSVECAAREGAVAHKEGLVTAYQIEGRTMVELEKLAAADQIEQVKNAAANLAALAACCCEIKELIKSDGAETRALINANSMQDLRDRAAKAETAWQLLFTKNAVPSVPVL